MKDQPRRFWCNVIAVASAGVSLLQAQPPSYAGAAPEGWMTRKWDGDGSHYRHIGQEIDAKITSGVPLPTLTAQYGQEAQARPADPEAQFAWAYCAVQNSGLLDYPVLAALVKDDPGNVYEYARLRFLATRLAEPNNDNRYLQVIGFRLLRHTPNDEVVHKNLVYALCSSPASLPKALQVAQAWTAQKPDAAGPHAVLAYVYQTLFDYSRGRDREDATAAVAEYQKYLRYAPPTDTFRKHATLMVRVLPTETAW